LMLEILAWTRESWKDYIYWQGQDKKTLKRINKLISDTQRSPFEGIGKPEPLKENLSGFGRAALMTVIVWFMRLMIIS
jgi:toxin YoeB